MIFDFEFDFDGGERGGEFDIYMKLGPKRMIFSPGRAENLEELNIS